MVTEASSILPRPGILSGIISRIPAPGLKR